MDLGTGGGMMANLDGIFIRARDEDDMWGSLGPKPGREELLNPCKRSTEPVVLVSTSINLGLAFPHDLCLAGDTEIVTEKGPKAIAEINVGDNVLTHKGRFRTVYKSLQREYEGPMVVIAVHNGASIRMTPEHELYAWSEKYFPAYRGHPVLRQASLVKKGDYLYEVYAARTAHLLKVLDVRSEAFDGKVYNLRVMQDESYVIHEGPAVHS
jgi:stringent starvation protein B